MELQAVLEAVTTLRCPIDIYSDSTYVVKCFNDKWYEGWLDRGWKNSQKKPVANRDLWEPLIDEYLSDIDRLRFFWVKGHSGDQMNDLVDAMAVAEVEKQKVAASTAKTLEDVSAPWPVERAVAVIGADGARKAAAIDALGQLNADSVIISGLRRSFELDLAEAAIEAGLDLGVVLPFTDPVGHWSEADRDRFDAACQAAEWVVTLDGDRVDPAAAISKRNTWLKSAVIALITSDPSVGLEHDAAGVSVIEV